MAWKQRSNCPPSQNFSEVVTVCCLCCVGAPGLDWLRGRSPVLPLRLFKARWGHREVLCRAEFITMLTLRWTAAHPVPLPTEGIG